MMFNYVPESALKRSRIRICGTKKNRWNMSRKIKPWMFGIEDNFLSILSPRMAIVDQILGGFCPCLGSLSAIKIIWLVRKHSFKLHNDTRSGCNSLEQIRTELSSRTKFSFLFTFDLDPTRKTLTIALFKRPKCPQAQEKTTNHGN